jgi:hypothetical protein
MAKNKLIYIPEQTVVTDDYSSFYDDIRICYLEESLGAVVVDLDSFENGVRFMGPQDHTYIFIGFAPEGMTHSVVYNEDLKAYDTIQTSELRPLATAEEVAEALDVKDE